MSLDTPSATRSDYRPDIDGLRAIAVAAVVIFHAFPAIAPGGFTGVDVFFVISGYLISGIILQAIEAGHFSFASFYARRILRIFPALVCVLATSLMAGWLLLPPYQFTPLGRESAAGALFAANFLFWNEISYFTADAASKPLLHLWSLGVEEQFYLFWPLVLYVAARRRWTLAIILIAGIVSFFLRRHIAGNFPEQAFYLPQYRFWELMLGALCAHPLVKSASRRICERYANPLSICGAAMIGFAIASDGKAHLVASTFGAALLIAASPSWINRKLLSHRAAVAIGKISYPIYLWHWPLLYFSRLMGHNTISDTFAALGATILLSVLTYLFVERPLQRSKLEWRRMARTSGGLIAAMALVACFSVAITVHAGFPDRDLISLSPLPPAQAKLESQLLRASELKYDYGFAALYGNRPCFRYKQTQTEALFVENGCLKPQFPSRPNVFIFGDSHAAALSIGLLPLLAAQQINFERVTYGWCEPTAVHRDPTCDAMNALALSSIEELKPDLVILDAYWLGAIGGSYFHGTMTNYMDAVLALVSDLKRRGASHILVVGQMPVYDPSLPQRLIEDYVRLNKPLPQRLTSARPDSFSIDDQMRALPYPAGVDYVSLRDALCNPDGCMDAASSDVARDVLLWDYGHLTAAGSNYVAHQIIMPAIDRIMAER